MATLKELLSRLDSEPSVRGFQFEPICKWFLQNSPVYRALLDDVWLWKEWADRWGPDCGIDLVAKTFDGGGYVASQWDSNSYQFWGDKTAYP
jgi:predicted helicase